MKVFCFINIILMVCSASFAGTLIFKNGTRISDVEIISISDNQITIRKDKKKRTYPLQSIRSYYKTDLGDAGEGVSGEFADYDVKILKINMPKKGYVIKKRKNVTSKCKIEYFISSKGSSSKIKVPYFYLYVIVPGKNEVSEREIYRYVYPKNAKPRGKGYDEAAILKKLSDFGRPVWDTKHREIKEELADRKLNIALKNVKNRKILAWHLEVWGNSEKLIDKTKDIVRLDGYRVDKNWWKRY